MNNNTGEDGGDHVYTASYILNPPVCTAVVPEITSINSGSDFGNLPNFAGGSWIEVKGRNLASNTRVWEDSAIFCTRSRRSLDGIRVVSTTKTHMCTT